MRVLPALTMLALALLALPTAQADDGADAAMGCLLGEGGEVEVHCFDPDHRYCVIRVHKPWINAEYCPGG